MASDLIASTDELSQLLRRLAGRERVRSEATVQADVRQLLLTAGLDLEEHDLDVQLETQVGDRRRIDVEVGFTVIEVKRDLSNRGLGHAAEEQLAGYVAARAAQTGQRYVGVLTDGREWYAYQEQGGKLVVVTQHVINPTKPDTTALLFWLEGVLASRQGVPPTPTEIRARLGATSASYALDRATLAALYAEHGARQITSAPNISALQRSRSPAGRRAGSRVPVAHCGVQHFDRVSAHALRNWQLTRHNQRKPAASSRGAPVGKPAKVDLIHPVRTLPYAPEWAILAGSDALKCEPIALGGVQQPHRGH